LIYLGVHLSVNVPQHLLQEEVHPTATMMRLMEAASLPKGEISPWDNAASANRVASQQTSAHAEVYDSLYIALFWRITVADPLLGEMTLQARFQLSIA
jgi:hypothetical protein